MLDRGDGVASKAAAAWCRRQQPHRQLERPEVSYSGKALNLSSLARKNSLHIQYRFPSQPRALPDRVHAAHARPCTPAWWRSGTTTAQRAVLGPACSKVWLSITH
eukprot:355996-Chlamydomonas_euryale.AAC.3